MTREEAKSIVEALVTLRNSATDEPVSYTHLDVYKRQGCDRGN